MGDYRINFNWGQYQDVTLSEWLDYIFNNSSLPPAVQAFLISAFVIICLIALAALIMQIVGMVKTFVKAKQPGWAAIIPYYNMYTIVKFTGLEYFWFLALILASMTWHAWIPGLIIFALLNYKIAKSFGKDTGFAVGLTLLPPIFWLILGVSKDIKYVGPAGPYTMTTEKKK